MNCAGRFWILCRSWVAVSLFLLVGSRRMRFKLFQDLQCSYGSGDVEEVLDLGTKIMVGHVFGIAGLIIGLARLRNVKGLRCLWIRWVCILMRMLHGMLWLLWASI